jgi:arginine exporter protein ArgO
MSKLLVIAIATAGVTPFVAPIPASLSALLGPAYLVVFGVALFMAGRAMRRPSENPSAETEKNSWSNRVPQSSTVTPM